MRLPTFIWARLAAWGLRIEAARPPNKVIGPRDNAYMRRWWIRRRKEGGIFNVYLHRFLRSDNDRALHDHPWLSVAVVLFGEYDNHEILYGGVHRRRRLVEGDVIFRRARHVHRVELVSDTALTLFITGPKIRSWGFHCPGGWVHWSAFTADRADGEGPGCSALEDGE